MPEHAPGWSLESELWTLGYRLVAGIDEAGRGALAGPVVAAVVVLPVTTHPFVDSKTVGEDERECLAALVRERALGWAVGEASAAEVDAVNVLVATKLAAERALRALSLPPRSIRPDAIVTDYLPLDAARLASWGGPEAQLTPPRAESRSFQVAAASLIAKTHRDALMRAAALRWPGYGFERNKGYGAPVHLRALTAHGPCPWHRATFRPVGRAPHGDPRPRPDQEERCQTASV